MISFFLFNLLSHLVQFSSHAKNKKYREATLKEASEADRFVGRWVVSLGGAKGWGEREYRCGWGEVLLFMAVLLQTT